MSKIKELLTTAWTWYQGRSESERRMLAALAVVVTCFALFMTWFSFSNSAASIIRRTASKRTRLQQAEVLAASYQNSQRKRAALERKLSDNNLQLISFVGDKGTAAGLVIPSLNPKGDTPIGDGRIIENSVEVTLTDVKLPALVTFLSSLERGPGLVKVKRLRIEPNPSSGVLTAWATIATYRLKGGS